MQGQRRIYQRNDQLIKFSQRGTIKIKEIQ